MTVCFTGHRPQHFSFGFDEGHPDCVFLKKTLQDEILRQINEGADTFICGMAQGTDIWAAEAVLKFKDDFPHIRLIAAIPCPDQTKRWVKSSVLRYKTILEKCDEKITISPFYHAGCMHQRNRYMVDNSDVLIAVYDNSESGGTAFTVNYAKKLGKTIVNIIP